MKEGLSGFFWCESFFRREKAVYFKLQSRRHILGSSILM